jgi:hypothetical protein
MPNAQRIEKCALGIEHWALGMDYTPKTLAALQAMGVT